MIELASFADCLDLVTRLRHEPLTEPRLRPLGEHSAETLDHVVRVACLAIDLGLEQRFKADEIDDLGRAGLLHDIGKRDVPRVILHKDGPLTPDEQALMDRHVRASFNRLVDYPIERVRIIVIQHHEFQRRSYPRSKLERRNGARATPDRRALNTVELAAQLLALADKADALTHRRRYQPSRPHAFGRHEVLDLLTEQFTGDAKLIKLIAARLRPD